MAKNLDLGVGYFRLLMREIEDTFRIKLDRDEVDKLKTAGDIHAVLVQRFVGCSGRKCARTMAFFRLRGALKRRGLKKIATRTDLSRLMRFKGKRWLEALEDDCGLRLPRARARFLKWLPWAVGVPGVALIALASYLGNAQWLYVGCFALIGAVVLSQCDFYELPVYCRSIDALSLITAQMNYGRLVEQGARARPDDIWGVLVNLLQAISNLAKDEIRPEAVLRGS